MVTSYTDVYAARGEVFARLADMLGMRPRAIGVIDIGEGRYGLKVSLPETPALPPPDVMDGITLQYALMAEPATLLGGDLPEWRRRIRASGP